MFLVMSTVVIKAFFSTERDTTTGFNRNGRTVDVVFLFPGIC